METRKPYTQADGTSPNMALSLPVRLPGFPSSGGAAAEGTGSEPQGGAPP